MSISSSPSGFAVTCNLLSQLLKGRSLADIGRDIGKPETCRTPATTTTFLPELDVSDGNATRQPEKSQLTIFYGGKMLVFDSFPADKAKELMSFAGKGNTTTTTTTTTTDANNTDPTPPPTAPVVAAISVPSNNPPKPVAADLPIARKASLHRFLTKRKDRINARAPYQVDGVKESGKAKDESENQPWLGLNPSLSSETSK